MTRWHTHNRRKKRHVSKDLWRFIQSAKRVIATQEAQIAWHLHDALMGAVDDIAASSCPDIKQRQMFTEVLEGFTGSMVNAVLGKAHWDIVYTEIGQEQLAALNRHLNP